MTPYRPARGGSFQYVAQIEGRPETDDGVRRFNFTAKVFRKDTIIGVGRHTNHVAQVLCFLDGELD